MNTQIVWLRILVGSLCLTAYQQVSFAQNAARPQTATHFQATPKGESSHRLPVMIAEWTRARDWTQEYIAKMPEGSFGFKPVPEVRSFAEQMLHLAYWNFGFTAKAFGRTSPYQEADLMRDDFRAKAQLSKVVAESYDFVISGLRGLLDDQLDEPLTMRDGTTKLRIERINDAYEHQTHHRGQTVIYLRLKSVEPPIEPF